MPILDVDLSAIEWRICAELTQDKVMMDEIITGRDPHGATCTELMELPLTKENRTGAKAFNFRMIYADLDTAAYAYFMDPKMPQFTKTKWDSIITNTAAKYCGLVDTHAAWVQQVYSNGSIRGPTGRIWAFKRIEKQRKGILYKDYSKAQIYNYPVQGTSADIIRLALVESVKQIKQKKIPVLFINTVHDSLIFDGESYEACYDAAVIVINVFKAIPDLMLKYFKWKMTVPITGEAAIGPNWKDVKEIKL